MILYINITSFGFRIQKAMTVEWENIVDGEDALSN